MAYLFNDFDEKDRIAHLEKEILRLQELCRTNFGVIADLKKKNEKLTEIQMELKETTSDLAYSLAEYPWWGQVDHNHTLNAFRVLVTYTKNIQYILQLPIFFDPVEQLQCYGLNQDKAARYLKMRYCGKARASPCFKCPKCKKEFTSEDRRNKHSALHSNMKKKLHCTQCNKYIPSFRSFKSHLQSHAFTNQMMAFPPIMFRHVAQEAVTEVSKPSPPLQLALALPTVSKEEAPSRPNTTTSNSHDLAKEEMDWEMPDVVPLPPGGTDGRKRKEADQLQPHVQLTSQVVAKLEEEPAC